LRYTLRLFHVKACSCLFHLAQADKAPPIVRSARNTRLPPSASQASQSEMAQHRRRWTGRMRTDNACTSPVRLPLQPSYDAQKARMTRGSRPARLLFMQCARTAGMIVQKQPAPVSLGYEVRNPTRGTRAFTGLNIHPIRARFGVQSSVFWT